MNEAEWQTRKQRIDTRLRGVHPPWQIIRYHKGQGEDDADRLDIPIHAFDLIIADECHRGYTAQATSIWRDTIQHFDAIHVGLTATPAAHTVALHIRV